MLLDFDLFNSMSYDRFLTSIELDIKRIRISPKLYGMPLSLKSFISVSRVDKRIAISVISAGHENSRPAIDSSGPYSLAL